MNLKRSKTREDQTHVMLPSEILVSASKNRCRRVVMETIWHSAKLWGESLFPLLLIFLLTHFQTALTLFICSFQSPSGRADSRWRAWSERETIQRAEAVRSREEGRVVGLGPARHTHHWWASTAHSQHQVRDTRDGANTILCQMLCKIHCWSEDDWKFCSEHDPLFVLFLF